MKFARGIPWVAVVAMLAACGGGGGSGLTGVSIGYPSSSYVFVPGVVAQTLQATVTGGATLTKWTVSPALPAGLTLDPNNGSITGLPASATPAGTYTVTASNSQGQVTTALTLSVAGSTLLNLGLAGTVNLIRYANTSVLSQDSTGAWLLQDFASGTILASAGPSSSNNVLGVYVDLENDVMIDTVPTANTLEVRSATTGNLLASIQIPAQASCDSPQPSCQVNWYRLATDGSYVVGGTATALTVWSTSGQTLFSIAGDYAFTSSTSPQPFAAPGQVQLANLPASASAIQTVTVPGGVASSGPTFQGGFSTWFVDGQSFLTTLGDAVFTYSAAGVKLDVTTVSTNPPITLLGGSGSWFWACTDTNVATIYKVGASATPALTTGSCGPNSLASGSTLALIAGASGLTVVDLSGATPSSTSYTPVPSPAGNSFLSGFAAESATKWLIGDALGVVFDGSSLAGTPRSLTPGAALSVVAGNDYISVATASGQIFVFNSGNDTPAGTIAFPASLLAASSDGTVLAASGNGTLNVYSLPSGTLINTFSYTSGITELGLAESGTVVAEAFNRQVGGCYIQVNAVAGGSPIVCDNSSSDVNIRLSPNGALSATSPAANIEVTTNIYNSSALVTAVQGYAVGWLDNNDLLLNNFTLDESGEFLEGDGLTIYDAAGTQVGTSPIMTADALQIVPGSTSVYDLKHNTIATLSTGAVTWAYGSQTNGGTPASVGLTASQVVLASDNLVLAVPY